MNWTVVVAKAAQKQLERLPAKDQDKIAALQSMAGDFFRGVLFRFHCPAANCLTMKEDSCSDGCTSAKADREDDRGGAPRLEALAPCTGQTAGVNFGATITSRFGFRLRRANSSSSRVFE